jgi:hypothetical protein
MGAQHNGRALKWGANFNGGRACLQSPDEAAEEEEYDGAGRGNADGAEVKLSRRDRPPPEESRSEPAANEGADDSEEDRDDTT